MITREEYLNGKRTHSEYYLQFAKASAWRYVQQRIGLDRIAKSTCEHFNDIPLALWDSLDMRPYIDTKLKAEAEGCARGSFYWSMSDNVCIAKAVAHRIRNAASALP